MEIWSALDIYIYIYFSLPFIFVESDWLYVMGLRAESMSCVYKKITLMHIYVRM